VLQKYNLPDTDKIRNLDQKCIETIMCEIVDKGQVITWDDIAGLADVKAGIDEAVVYPMLNSEIF
jgi:SpoVK/Ycf46/Vps4 family AAA+-type ATPase